MSAEWKKTKQIQKYTNTEHEYAGRRCAWWYYHVCTCSVKISCVKIVFILLRELGLMAIWRKVIIGTIMEGLLWVKTTYRQQHSYFSLFSYITRKILHGRHNAELSLPWGWKQTGFKSNYTTHHRGKYMETGNYWENRQETLNKSENSKVAAGYRVYELQVFLSDTVSICGTPSMEERDQQLVSRTDVLTTVSTLPSSPK